MPGHRFEWKCLSLPSYFSGSILKVTIWSPMFPVCSLPLPPDDYNAPD
jgi:hypothetical protein